jgi:hypothetical protein
VEERDRQLEREVNMKKRQGRGHKGRAGERQDEGDGYGESKESIKEGRQPQQ